MLDAALLDHFRSLTLLENTPSPTFYPPPPRTSPQVDKPLGHPRPPTPPPARRPSKPNTSASRRPTRIDVKVCSIHTDRPVPVHTAKRTQRVWHDKSGRREAEENVFRDQNKRTRFVVPDAEDKEEGAWRTNAVNTTRRASGPLRSILRNKHAGATPYQKVPVRYAVRWA